MVEALALLMRTSITTKERLIPLTQELEVLNGYMTIQKVRYEERLELEEHIDPTALNCLIPPLTLQIVVENAIKHSLDVSVEQCHIRLIICPINGHFVRIEIEDNGPGIEPKRLDKILKNEPVAGASGIGIKNIIDRLNIDFGNRATFNIESTLGKGTKIRIILPKGVDSLV